MPSRFVHLLFLVSFPVLLFWCGGLPGQEEEKDKPAKEYDAAAITKLIEQLGSPKVTERLEATEALKAIGSPALDNLRKAAKGDDPDVALRAARLVKIIENGSK